MSVARPPAPASRTAYPSIQCKEQHCDYSLHREAHQSIGRASVRAFPDAAPASMACIEKTVLVQPLVTGGEGKAIEEPVDGGDDGGGFLVSRRDDDTPTVIDLACEQRATVAQSTKPPRALPRKLLCPTPGCDGFGHVAGIYAYHRSVAGCPKAAKATLAVAPPPQLTPMCPTPGCHGRGHINPARLFHRTLAGCPMATMQAARKPALRPRPEKKVVVQFAVEMDSHQFKDSGPEANASRANMCSLNMPLCADRVRPPYFYQRSPQQAAADRPAAAALPLETGQNQPAEKPYF